MSSGAIFYYHCNCVEEFILHPCTFLVFWKSNVHTFIKIGIKLQRWCHYVETNKQTDIRLYIYRWFILQLHLSFVLVEIFVQLVSFNKFLITLRCYMRGFRRMFSYWFNFCFINSSIMHEEVLYVVRSVTCFCSLCNLNL